MSFIDFLSNQDLEYNVIPNYIRNNKEDKYSLEEDEDISSSLRRAVRKRNSKNKLVYHVTSTDILVDEPTSVSEAMDLFLLKVSQDIFFSVNNSVYLDEDDYTAYACEWYQKRFGNTLPTIREINDSHLDFASDLRVYRGKNGYKYPVLPQFITGFQKVISFTNLNDADVSTPENILLYAKKDVLPSIGYYKKALDKYNVEKQFLKTVHDLIIDDIEKFSRTPCKEDRFSFYKAEGFEEEIEVLDELDFLSPEEVANENEIPVNSETIYDRFVYEDSIEHIERCLYEKPVLMKDGPVVNTYTDKYNILSDKNVTKTLIKYALKNNVSSPALKELMFGFPDKDIAMQNIISHIALSMEEENVQEFEKNVVSEFEKISSKIPDFLKVGNVLMPNGNIPSTQFEYDESIRRSLYVLGVDTVNARINMFVNNPVVSKKVAFNAMSGIENEYKNLDKPNRKEKRAMLNSVGFLRSFISNNTTTLDDYYVGRFSFNNSGDWLKCLAVCERQNVLVQTNRNSFHIIRADDFVLGSAILHNGFSKPQKKYAEDLLIELKEDGKITDASDFPKDFCKCGIVDDCMNIKNIQNKLLKIKECENNEPEVEM